MAKEKIKQQLRINFSFITLGDYAKERSFKTLYAVAKVRNSKNAVGVKALMDGQNDTKVRNQELCRICMFANREAITSPALLTGQ